MDSTEKTEEPKTKPNEHRPFARGRAVIADALRGLTGAPGVYRMLDGRGSALYVGKAKNLRKRVTSYLQVSRLPTRLKRMVAATHQLEVVTTRTEAEALLLEANLIKQFKPRYNVLLRDDKSFPSILITRHEWPQLTKHRGAASIKGDYFGPFASVGAVNETLAALERAFLLRSCPDTVFENRSRPCLLYQIRRCSGPCVRRISHEDYEALVREATDFLSGRHSDIQRDLAARMQEASDALDYERASVYRDRLRALSQVQSRQDVNLPRLGDLDVIGIHQAGGHSCIEVFFYRGGRNFGNRAYFPAHDADVPVPEVLGAFLGQFYSNKEPAGRVLVSHRPPDVPVLEEALTSLKGQRVRVESPTRGNKRRLVENAVANAREALERRLAEGATQRRLLEGVAGVFGLEAPPERIEVYDNSHVSGTHAVGAMVVAGPEGFIKNAYRKFTIRTVGAKLGDARKVPTDAGLAEASPAFLAATDAEGPHAPPRAGDDYAMIREVLTRRFKRALREDPDRASLAWPDLVMIDGGPGHLAIAHRVMADLGVADIALVAIAKGPDRNAGRERFFMVGREPFQLEPQDPVLYFLQRLRDEAHRFAIGAHRAKRSKAISHSILDDVPGIGAKRKRALLHHFGSARDVAAAAVEDLALVDGISRAVAKKIYDHFHDGR